MKMSPKYLVFVVLFLATAQFSTGLENDAKGLLKKFKNWIKAKEEQLKEKIENAAHGLIDLEQSLVENAMERIHESVNAVENDLDIWKVNLPAKCYTPAQEMLTVLKAASAADFFKCTNLSKAVADAEQIASQTADMVVKVLEFCNIVLDSINECQPWVTTEGLKCINNHVIKVIQDLKKELPVLETYFRDVVRIGKDLRAQVESCLHPSKAKLQEQLNDVMTTLHSCTA